MAKVHIITETSKFSCENLRSLRKLRNSLELSIIIPIFAPKYKAMEEKRHPKIVVNSVLQMTPDIEEEIAEVERGEAVSMSEFKSIFSKWFD